MPAGGGAASATACPSRTACTLLDREFITPLGLPGVISTALAMGAKCLITRARANRDNQLPEAPACSCLHSLSPSLSHTRAEVFFYDCYLANRRNRRDQPREREREREWERAEDKADNVVGVCVCLSVVMRKKKSSKKSHCVCRPKTTTRTYTHSTQITPVKPASITCYRPLHRYTSA